MICYTLIRLWKLLLSLIMYLVWIQPQSKVTEEILEGRIDRVVETGKAWRVRCLATYWAARSHQTIHLTTGDYIRVVGRKGLILFIEPLEKQEISK